MFHEPPESFALTHPASQWTGPVKVRFLECLSQRGNVRLAARRVGLSAETAYRQRRRDPVFARGWAAAIALARRESEQVLADRAIDGVEEAVWYRGEVVGTRRRYDTRLLLAYLARLDKLASEAPEGEADAERFDELLAVIGGADTAGLAAPDELPPDRQAFAAERSREAALAVDAAWAVADGEDGQLDADRRAQYWTERNDAEADGWIGGEAQWDEWRARAHRAVDAMLDGPPEGAPQGSDEAPPEPCQRRQHPRAGETACDPIDRRADEPLQAAAGAPPEQALADATRPAPSGPAGNGAPPEPGEPIPFRPVPRARIQLAET